jgi:hypothetical protein
MEGRRRWGQRHVERLNKISIRAYMIMETGGCVDDEFRSFVDFCLLLVSTFHTNTLLNARFEAIINITYHKPLSIRHFHGNFIHVPYSNCNYKPNSER